MADYSGLEHAGAGELRGIIADAAKDYLRDAEGAGARSAARDTAKDTARDAAQADATSVSRELETKPLLSKYRGENSGDVNAPFRGTVRYLDEAGRDGYKLTVRDGKLVDADGALFDTTNAATVHSGGGRAIYVMDGEGNLYASTYQRVGDFHHSSFLAGGDVAGAGELRVVDGQLESISRKSGHYFPTESMQRQVVDVLGDKGADLSRLIEEAGF